MRPLEVAGYTPGALERKPGVDHLPAVFYGLMEGHSTNIFERRFQHLAADG